MADLRIKDLTTTATEADLVSGNYLAIDGSAGTKKLPANLVAPKSTAEKSRLTFRFYNPSKVVVECLSASPFTIYFTYDETLVLFGSIGSTNKGRSVNISDLATELGVSLVTSPNGVTNCVEIASGYSLVYNVSDSQYHLRLNSVGSIEEGDVVLLLNNRGCVGYGELLPEIIDFSNGYYNSISVYGSSGSAFEIEETNTSSGSIYFKGTIVFNGRFTKTWSMADIASALGVSLVTSPSGISGCLEITDGNSLCVSIYGAVALLAKSKITSRHKIVAECKRGQVVEGCLVQYILSQIKDSRTYAESLAEGVKKYSEDNRLVFRFYNPSKVVVESSASPFTIYFTYNQTLVMSGKIGSTSVGRSVDVSALATELEVSLVTSPNGEANCIEIANGYSIVYNIDDKKYHIRDNSVGSVVLGDIVLLFNNRGCIGNGVLLPEIIDFLNGYYNSIVAYGMHRTPIYLEETKTSGGSIYIGGTLVLGGKFGKTWNISNLATALGVSLVTSPGGTDNCLEIEDGKVLCFTIYGAPALLNLSAITSQHKIFLACEDGQVVGGCLDQYYMSRFSDIEKKLIGTPFSSASDDVAEAIANVAGEYDTFLFFSDAHCMSYNGMFEDADQNRVTNFVNDAKKTFVSNAINKAFCGGDLLSTGDTQVEALKKLRYFAGLVRREFDCYLAVGNHDTNYLGKLDSESAANTGLLSNVQQVGEMINIGSTYYVVSSNNTDYYILDTGTDSSGNMDSFRWEQIDWLAGKLHDATKEHAVVIMHIYSRGTEDSNNWSSMITQMATNLQTLLGALNSRGSVSLNGNTYNFANAVQKVRVIMCGHTHYDYVDDTGNVPVVCITRTFHNKLGKAYDACILDYGASKLKCVRFGGFGTNREISIVT